MQRLRPSTQGTSEDRGQVGIGTLIVFIAMVLVAAIAAGVLINTAGFLQNSAQATGQQSSDSTTNRIQVVGMTGDHFTSNSEVGVVDIVVRRAPGASNVDLDKTTIQWIGPSGSYYQLAAGGADGNPDGRFAVSTVQDNDGSQPVLNDVEDRFRITLDLGADNSVSAVPFGEELPEGETATLRITSPAGGMTTEEVVVPKTLSGESSVTL
ncbi:archaellin/type IV pilin N-terminal domain-containing protein [Haloarcula sp. NS06]|uniref:archaellin/type IV pilin N-terminal domain-containing protein n=1 Tax=unclassified Haloarcula TaxID=2624677 RepID=UPI0027B1E23E|nr:archaellin/type IV pilin N-terminal domain-containing protein [Haloarcula sp. H-GB4]MDQ2073726.1 flagellin [Haloarcula sp. H-GB4]